MILNMKEIIEHTLVTQDQGVTSTRFDPRCI